MLLYFRNEDKFEIFKKEDLKDYSKFLNLINKFREEYKLGTFSLKQIDKYLWLLGKKIFPKQPKAQKTII